MRARITALKPVVGIHFIQIVMEAKLRGFYFHLHLRDREELMPSQWGWLKTELSFSLSLSLFLSHTHRHTCMHTGNHKHTHRMTECNHVCLKTKDPLSAGWHVLQRGVPIPYMFPQNIGYATGGRICLECIYLFIFN